MTAMKLLVACVLALSVTVLHVSGHGRIVDPPQRGSLWRLPEYAWANPGHQADDQELFCGGREVTDPYIGACGVCGDSIMDPKPRKHEIGGEFERGIITRNYTVGQTIPVELFIAVNHQGWHEFRLCQYNGQETESCFNQNLLRFSDGKTRQNIPGQQQVHSQLVLPAGVTCDRCILQWSWFGEGSNQYYRNCADVSIH